MASFDNADSDMYVTKRNQHREIMSFDKILKRIKKVGAEANIKINYTSLAMKVIDQLYDGISTTKIDELTAEQCASMSSTHPDYNVLAGRITVSNHHKNTKPSFYQTMKDLYQYKDQHGNHYPLISQTLYKNICGWGKEKVDAICDYSRDYSIDFFGFKTLERAYLMRINKKIVERPQHMWLRVSFGIHGTDWDRAIETYTYMSQKYFTHATPTLFNSGTPKPQLSSCYLMSMEEDSIDGIFNTLKDCALISKWAGGIGLHIHNVRASGSQIRGTNGTSNGIVPMLKVFNNTAKYVDQGGGKRNGSFAIYLEPWHADIEMFLQMRKNHGDEELKARDLFYALWVPDLFMERVRDGKNWTLMCPAECPGLSDVIGDEFVKLYEQYERDQKGRQTIPARDLWFQILDAQMETGTPYLLFKDAANRKSNQKNLGVIKSSNLCVSPDTHVLTTKGQYPIYALWAGNYPTEDAEAHKTIQVWNGQEWSEVEVQKTGENVSFVEVRTSDGARLTCTPYHKFYIRDGTGAIITKEAQELLCGDLLEMCEFPFVDGEEAFPEGTAEDEGNASGIRHLKMKCGKTEHIHVPINYAMQDKMEWFSAFIEPYVVQMYERKTTSIVVPSISRVVLEDLKYMLQTCGINTIIRDYPEPNVKTGAVAEWVVSLIQLRFLKEKHDGISFHTFTWDEPPLTPDEFKSIDLHINVRVVSVEASTKIDDSYCFTEPLAHAGVFNGMRTSQCTEIIEYSDSDETAVCNLASIALPAFINKDARTFDYEKLHEITRVVTRNLNRVIDINYYPTPKTERSNMRHRPIGLGVQGLADTFFLMGLSFSSPEAKTINKHVFETIYHAALEESCAMAQEEGAYETFPGSPASEGILQFDMWNAHPGNERYDWDALKEKIQTHGLRNSLLMAPMPTASTSQILGYNECIEPITSNIYSRRTLAGEFILVNKYLMQEMLAQDMWNETFKNQMVANNGSIQGMEYLSSEIREKYRTVWEIPMRDLIDMAADRGAFICQSQSLNLWLEDPNYNTMTSMHFYSWNKGLKTGIYYLRRRPRHNAQQFTIEPEKRAVPKEEDIGCEMCSA